jgi:hypothetical protein
MADRRTYLHQYSNLHHGAKTLEVCVVAEVADFGGAFLTDPGDPGSAVIMHNRSGIPQKLQDNIPAAVLTSIDNGTAFFVMLPAGFYHKGPSETNVDMKARLEADQDYWLQREWNRARDEAQSLNEYNRDFYSFVTTNP